MLPVYTKQLNVPFYTLTMTHLAYLFPNPLVWTQFGNCGVTVVKGKGMEVQFKVAVDAAQMLSGLVNEIVGRDDELSVLEAMEEILMIEKLNGGGLAAKVKV
jgi:hypothetical protein